MTRRIPNKYCHSAKDVADFLGSAEWKLEHRYWWNYVTALRGPDIDDEFNPISLKALLTCVLRGTPYIIKDDAYGVSIAWDISYALDGDDYFYLFDNNGNCGEIDHLIESLSDIRVEHFKHHLALGFESLAVYYHHLVEDDGTEDDEINYKCNLILKNIHFDLERDHSNSVFKHIKEFLLLVSDEVN